MNKVQKYSGVVLQGLVLGVVTVVVIVLARETFSHDGLANKAYRSFVFENSLRAITSYQVRNVDYRGACADTALPEYIECVENGDAFKLEVERIEGGLYCADSTGFEGVVYGCTGASVRCAAQ